MIEDVPLRLGIPKPPARPGELADFSYLEVPPAGSVDRPDVDTDPHLRYARSRVRVDPGVFDDNGMELGPWNPEAEAPALFTKVCEGDDHDAGLPTTTG